MQSTQFVVAALRFAVWGAALLGVTALPRPLAAETETEAWLRYSALSPEAAKGYRQLPDKTVLLGDSVVLHTAQQELVRGGISQIPGPAVNWGSTKVCYEILFSFQTHFSKAGFRRGDRQFSWNDVRIAAPRRVRANQIAAGLRSRASLHRYKKNRRASRPQPLRIFSRTSWTSHLRRHLRSRLDVVRFERLPQRCAQ